MAYKYTGDSIINASLTVQTPKPLDSRTVVNNIRELYNIPAQYAYVGMTVANIDNGNTYMLIDKSKISEKAGWKASYESIQIITCTEAEYKEWKDNTDEFFQPINDLKDYIHQDTYYYIYEDSLSAESELQEYVKRSDWVEVLNTLSGKASNDALVNTNNEIAQMKLDYATIVYVQGNYVPKTDIDLNNPNSFLSTNFYTKAQTDDIFVTKASLNGGGLDGDDFVFVTAARYEEDQADLATYKQSIADELAQTLKVGANGQLDTLVISHIKSPEVSGQQLTVDVTPQGLSIGGDPLAKMSQVPKIINITSAAYQALVENDAVELDAYYFITDDAASYVLLGQLEANYHTIAQYQSWTTGQLNSYYTKTQIDTIVAGLQTSGNYVEVSALNNYYTKTASDDKYATKTQLDDYVTIAMLGGEGAEGDYIFVKNADYSAQRTQDLQTIANTYVEKNSDATLNSLETTTVKNGNNVVTISSQLLLNNKPLALSEDVPVIQTISKTAYDALNEKDPDVYYFIYNVDPELAFVTAQELSSYYTKPQVDSKITETVNTYIPQAVSAYMQDIATKTWVQGVIDDLVGIDAASVTELKAILSDDDTTTGLLALIATKADKSELFSGNYNDLTNKPTIPTVPTDVSAFNNDAGYLVSSDISGKANSADLATVATSGDYTDLSNKPTIPMQMQILEYGESTWDDFISLYNGTAVVYCRASSGSNPAQGSQTRLAFLAYVNNETNPTEAEFQYYRSLSTHTEINQGDEVYVYKLNKTTGWEVTSRKAYTRITVASGSCLTTSYNGSNAGYLTLDAPTAVTSSQSGIKLEIVSALPDSPDSNTIYIIQ